jgi:heat shock protein HslJ
MVQSLKPVRASWSMSFRIIRMATALAVSLAAAGCAHSQETAMSKSSALPDLVGTEWVLADFGGSGVSPGSEATLAFPQSGRVAGKSFCNRFTGSAQMTAEKVSFGQMASTRMACLPELMDRETRFLKALADAQRIAMDGPDLLLYSKGMEKPLRFTPKRS